MKRREDTVITLAEVHICIYAYIQEEYKKRKCFFCINHDVVG